jgi:hypothetical protein
MPWAPQCHAIQTLNPNAIAAVASNTVKISQALIIASPSRSAARPHVGGALFRNERLLMFWVVFYSASMTKRLLMFEVQLDGKHGERNRYECSGQPGTGQGLFCLGDSRVAEYCACTFSQKPSYKAVTSASPARA